ncbi:MAG: hypothetical protein AAGC85_21615 [Bacteroidota bacterium]
MDGAEPDYTNDEDPEKKQKNARVGPGVTTGIASIATKEAVKQGGKTSLIGALRLALRGGFFVGFMEPVSSGEGSTTLDGIGEREDQFADEEPLTLPYEPQSDEDDSNGSISLGFIPDADGVGPGHSIIGIATDSKPARWFHAEGREGTNLTFTELAHNEMVEAVDNGAQFETKNVSVDRAKSALNTARGLQAGTSLNPAPYNTRSNNCATK